jgi:hypothetical protein
MVKIKTLNTKPPVNQYKVLPFVSVCTVTFNRRPFWKTAFEIFKIRITLKIGWVDYS